MQIVETGPDDERFAAWCEVWAATQLADHPDEAPRPASDHVALGRRLTTPGGAVQGTHRAGIAGGTVVGALRLLLPVRDNTAVAYLDVAVHPAHRRRGVGTALLAEGVRLARAAGRSSLVAEVDEPGAGVAGSAFARHHGWACDLRETRRDLLLPVDEERLSVLESEAVAASAGYEVLTWRDRTPDALLEDRALLSRRMSTDTPNGDVPVGEEDWDAARVREQETVALDRGRTVLSAGALHDGRLVAFTDLHVPLAQPERADQSGTLVLPEHRGHRLGARVKIAVLRELAADVPQVRRISTYNSDTNRPMVAVNEALGFRRAGGLSTWSTRLRPGT
ncbi:Protein N-acetyltransferase, RimJ/RimL family [Geodermatophilus amargosae]|uniref:Protein N-acetyltransferase, RimJ/RimL family n=1 Tax=Geodermatophilus amargosae TaxID=1296565 RepID=A0A1I7BUY4_9ACTN|nr:GNAT family N-acetyltransferase [Geodermatophilus amargosae]SFT90994.1 Protein N-acetyltransferase, RimJ/RimL family [Geodermatophilus amargosae]